MTSQKEYDLVIIGAGAAGLTAAQYGARANLKTLVVEQGATGGQCLLIEGLENYPGFPEPLSGAEFTERFETQARQFGAEFLLAGAERLTKEEDRFRIGTTEGEILAKAVVLATGAKHRELEVPGERELGGRGVSYCATCDGPFFKGKKILVVGGGDAACDEAQFLSKLTDKVVMVHRRDRFRAQRSLAERVRRNPAIEVRFNTVVREIVGAPSTFGIDTVGSVRLADIETGEEYEEAFDAVFIFVGSIPRTALVPDVEKDEGGYIKTDETMQTGVEGLFAVGDVRATPFRQLVVAAGEGAVAAHAAAGYIDALEGVEYRTVTV
ncbi:MAG: thioredoxin-disulfide reductase [Spirochaetota bacterium]